MTQAALPGGDVSITASANKALYGSTKAEDVDDARSWSAEKDRLLSDVEQRARRAAAALSAAAKESAGLLAAGGVLVDRAAPARISDARRPGGGVVRGPRRRRGDVCEVRGAAGATSVRFGAPPRRRRRGDV